MPTLSQKPGPPRPGRAPRRRRLAFSTHPETRSIQIGVLGTILFHLLLIWLGPSVIDALSPDRGEMMAGSDASEPTYEVELLPPDVEEPEPPPPQQFVEVNPDAPDNIPDQTDNFGAQNQQVAQEEPAAAESEVEMPATVANRKEDDIESTAIVSGTRSEPQPPIVAAQPPPPEDAVQAEQELPEVEATRKAQDPLPGTEAFEGDNPDGFGRNLAEETDNASPVPEKIEGTPDATDTEEAQPAMYFRVDPNRPAARPQLAQAQIRPAFIANRVNGTSNLGIVAHNALRTTYGEYLNRLIDVVDIEWNYNIRDKLANRFSFPLDGSKVAVTFVLDKEGKVMIRKVDGNAGQLWNGVAVEAVAAPSRHSQGFGKWPDDMVAVLGDSQEITFTFHY